MNIKIQRALQVAAEAAKGGGSTDRHPSVAGMPVTFTPDAVKDDDKLAVCRFGDAAYDAYWGKGGVAELEAALEEKKEKGIAEQVRLIAMTAVRIAPKASGVVDMRQVRPVFLILCDIAETHVKAKHVQNGVESAITKLIPGWAQYKSGIATSLEFGINPGSEAVGGALKYPTASKLITAGREAKGGNANPPDGTTSSAGTAKEAARNALTAGFSAELSTALGLLHAELLKLRAGDEQPLAAQMVMQLVATLQQRFARGQRVAHGDAGTSNTAKETVSRESTPAIAGKGGKR